MTKASDQWRNELREAHQRYRDGKRPLKLNKGISLKRSIEFEKALHQRGELAKAQFEAEQRRRAA